jgi:hypothetical protein
MAERPRGPDTAAELEAALRSVGSAIAYPSAAGVAPAVTARIAAIRPSGRRPVALPASARRRRAIVAIAAAALLLAVVAAAARLSIGAVTIREGAPSASPPPVESVALGRPATLQSAGRGLGAPLTTLPPLGPPAAVYLDRVSEGTRVALAWRPASGLPAIPALHWGAVLIELRGDSALAAKTLYSTGGTLRTVEVDGGDGYWITGVHELDVVTSSGPQRSIVSGNVLLWTRGDATLRLETVLPQAAAVSLAEHASTLGPA